MAPSPHQRFTRAAWAALRADTPLTLTEDDLTHLRGLNERVSMDEVIDIYLPLSRLVNLHIGTSQALHGATANFLGAKGPGELRPAGAHHVLVGRQGRRGQGCGAGLFPPHVRHRPGRLQIVDQPDVVIVEGLNILQPGDRPAQHSQHLFASDFFDFTVYVDADVAYVRRWYIERFLALRTTAFQDPSSYFHRYADLTDPEAEAVASRIWRDINEPNLLDNILPTRERAHLILEKGPDHEVRHVRLRKW